MYLGRYFILLGFLMLLGAGWIALYTVAYWFYMDTRVEREEAHLRPIFGPRYDEYCAKVRRFFPGPPLAGQPVAYWSWTLFRQNNARGQPARYAGCLGSRGGWLLLR